MARLFERAPIGMIVFSHPTGNANVRQAALALHQSGQLDECWTCLAPSADDWWVRSLPSRLATQLLRRCPLPAIRQKMRSAPIRELGRLAAGSLGLSSLIRHERGIFSIDAVYRGLDRRVSREFTGSHSRNVRDAYAYVLTLISMVYYFAMALPEINKRMGNKGNS